MNKANGENRDNKDNKDNKDNNTKIDTSIVSFASFEKSNSTSATSATSKITVDEQGKVHLPVLLREHMGIYTGDQFEAVIHEGRIILARHTPTCFACGDDCDVQKLHRTFLCGVCRDVLRANMGVIHLMEIARSKESSALVGENRTEKSEVCIGTMDISESKSLTEATKRTLKEKGWGLL